MGKLDGKTAIVTGASRGIGRCIANALADEGVDLAISSLRNEKLEEARKDHPDFAVVKALEDPGLRALVENQRHQEYASEITEVRRHSTEDGSAVSAATRKLSGW